MVLSWRAARCIRSRCVCATFCSGGIDIGSVKFVEVQEYFSDPGKTSSVYHAVIDRASAEPIR